MWEVEAKKLGETTRDELELPQTTKLLEDKNRLQLAIDGLKDAVGSASFPVLAKGTDATAKFLIDNQEKVDEYIEDVVEKFGKLQDDFFKLFEQQKQERRLNVEINGHGIDFTKARLKELVEAARTGQVAVEAIAWDRRQSDPTEILGGHRRIGHFDRVTGAYSTPKLLGVGLAMRTFGPNDWMGWKDGGGVNIGEPGQLLRGVQITCTASWLQFLQGMLDLSAVIRDLFPALNVGPSADPKSLFGGFDPSVVIASGRVATLTPDDLERGIPQVGASIGGGSGYTVVKRVVTRVDPKRFAEGPQPRSVGPVHGTKGKYVYVRKEGGACAGSG